MEDASALERVAQVGLGAAQLLQDAIDVCRLRVQQTGDARYSIIAETLSRLDVWLDEHESAGGVPAEIRAQVTRELTTLLPAVLEGQSPADGALLAETLRSRVLSLLTPPTLWTGS